MSNFVEELERRDRELLDVLRIGHDTSIRGAGLSLREALARTRYRDIRQGFQEADLLPHLQASPSLVAEWLAYSEDKRTDGGWYILRDGTVGRLQPKESIRFASPAEAVAAYVVRELDFWASL